MDRSPRSSDGLSFTADYKSLGDEVNLIGDTIPISLFYKSGNSYCVSDRGRIAGRIEISGRFRYPSPGGAMKKIGFIDYYIDNWHANNYPRMIRESAFKNDFEVALAWQEVAPPGKKTLEEWCREQNVSPARSLEEVVDTCDCLLVLSPDDADRHLPLSKSALRSGKPVYIDKPFADRASDAREMLNLAAASKTPLMTSSSLRFTPALSTALKEKIRDKRVHFVSTWGGGRFPVYIVHVLEMLAMTLGTGARRVMSAGSAAMASVLIVDYPDKRRGLVQLFPGFEFGLAATYGDGESLAVPNMQGYFEAFIDAMLDFFSTGKNPIPRAQTLEIVALQEASAQALGHRDHWIEVEII
jgi:hypothetical protein